MARFPLAVLVLLSSSQVANALITYQFNGFHSEGLAHMVINETVPEPWRIDNGGIVDFRLTPEGQSILNTGWSGIGTMVLEHRPPSTIGGLGRDTRDNGLRSYMNSYTVLYISPSLTTLYPHLDLYFNSDFTKDSLNDVIIIGYSVEQDALGGAFGVEGQWTQAKTCDEILEGAISAPYKERVLEGSGLNSYITEYIVSELKPNFGMTIGEAAYSCGCDHFSYRNRFVEPKPWEVYVDDVLVKASGEVGPAFIDPLLGSQRMYTRDPRVSAPTHMEIDYPFSPDSHLPYWQENGDSNYGVFGRYPLNGQLLQFIDGPSSDSTIVKYDSGEFTNFFTELVGVDSTGNIVKTFPGVTNANFSWKSNQMDEGDSGHVFYRSTPIGAVDRRIVSGGIFDLQVVLAGDFDDDRDVDGNDFLSWQRSLGSQVQPFDGPDSDGDGIVGFGDFVLWLDLYGKLYAQSSNAIPEPSTVALIAASLVLLCRTRRKVRS